MVNYCAVHGCVSTSKMKKHKFFRLPRSDNRCNDWLRVMGRPDLCSKMTTLNSKRVLSCYRICDLHFVQSDMYLKKLKCNAFPTLMLPQPDTCNNNTKYTQTDEKLTNDISSQTKQDISTQTDPLDIKPRLLWSDITTQSENSPNTEADNQSSPVICKIEPNEEPNAHYSVDDDKILLDMPSTSQTNLQINALDIKPLILSSLLQSKSTKMKTGDADDQLTLIFCKEEQDEEEELCVNDHSRSSRLPVTSQIDVETESLDIKPHNVYNPIHSIETQTDFPPCSCNKRELVAEQDTKTIVLSDDDTTSPNLPSTSQVNTVPMKRGPKSRKRKIADENDFSLLTPELQKIVNMQKRLRQSNKGNRYDEEFKMFALDIYFASPEAYSIVSKTLCLPNERTLKRMDIVMGSKLSGNMVKCLEIKVRKLSESEKYCVLCIDEITVRKNSQVNKGKVTTAESIATDQATSAFVVMARGLFSNWKQPLAYSFLCHPAELRSWLDEIITKIIEIGFNVVAITSNLGKTFTTLASELNISIENPYFNNSDRDIYYMYDIPHLIKALRNTLINFNIIFDDTDGTELTATWDDIKTVYNVDKDKTYRMANKLTESHINPNSMDKTKTKYAAQIFSSSVAAAISCCIEQGHLPKESLGTLKIVKLFNDTFDIMNASSAKKAFSYKQVKTLKTVSQIMKNMRIVTKKRKRDVTKLTEVIDGFQLTIHSVLGLAMEMRSKGFNLLFTSRLNLDPLNNFFTNIRQQTGEYQNPTATQFINIFKKMFFTNIIRHSEIDCSGDSDNMLVSAKEAQQSVFDD